jgi:hypothetical protein
MASKGKSPETPLPKSWGKHVQSAILHIFALAQYARENPRQARLRQAPSRVWSRRSTRTIFGKSTLQSCPSWAAPGLRGCRSPVSVHQNQEATGPVSWDSAGWLSRSLSTRRPLFPGARQGLFSGGGGTIRVKTRSPWSSRKGIRALKDLTRDGIRVVVGHPQQGTIGFLTRQMLEKEGMYQGVMKNVVSQMPTASMMVPAMTTGSCDVALGWNTHVVAESERLETVRIESKYTKGIQSLASARSSDHKELAKPEIRWTRDGSTMARWMARRAWIGFRLTTNWKSRSRSEK